MFFNPGGLKTEEHKKRLGWIEKKELEEGRVLFFTVRNLENANIYVLKMHRKWLFLVSYESLYNKEFKEPNFSLLIRFLGLHIEQTLKKRVLSWGIKNST